jgi:type III restriction enzyme
MVRLPKMHPAQLSLFEDDQLLKTAPCVPILKEEVRQWRRSHYPGITTITSSLLDWWFYQEHPLPTGEQFQYYSAQQEAIETLIYIYEVKKARTRYDLLSQFAQPERQIYKNTDEDFARYCIKMATGSGKTKVMALAIVWHYFNAIASPDSKDFARTFLIIAPNVIVFERLKLDFSCGHIFHIDPMIPEHLRSDWDFEYLIRDENRLTHSTGLLLLTNIQQLYKNSDHRDKDNGSLRSILGISPKRTKRNSTLEFLHQHSNQLLIMNDEAHHLHDEKNKWNEVIGNIHHQTPILSQLDFSATPRTEQGKLFPWVIFDYPLKQAVSEKVIKRPYKGIVNISENHSIYASEKYRGFIVAAVQRWREYRDELSKSGKRPILFIMLGSTQEADEVGDHLRRAYPSDFEGEKTLIIHTRVDGEITEGDIEQARKVAREVDQPNCPVNAIVSVLMLREGWDVQSVTVIVGLRPYNSKAKILPEQTVGRGLRLMFPHNNTGYIERVDIIGNKAFLKFVEDLEKIEDYQLSNFDVEKDKISIATVYPDPHKQDYDIIVPKLSTMLVRKKLIAEDLMALDVKAFKCPPLPKKPGDAAEQAFRYDGYDYLTLEKEVERNYTITSPKNANEVIGYYAREIAKDLHLPSQFALIAPKVREFFELKAFGEDTDINNPIIIQAMNRSANLYVVKRLFHQALSHHLFTETEPIIQVKDRSLSAIQPFPFSNNHAYSGRKCLLNYAPCSNLLEQTFAQFLDEASDVAAWCKLPHSFGFAIEYLDQQTNLHYYYPDFIARTIDDVHWIIETKGREDTDVTSKDDAGKRWCKYVTKLTNQHWEYIRVQEDAFKAINPTELSDLENSLFWLD